MSPPNVTKPTEPGGDVGLVEATTNADGSTKVTPRTESVQVGVGIVGALRTFPEIVRSSTPAELLMMAALHYKYAPRGAQMPEALHRAIARSWVDKYRGVQ